jgi:hypothetical protein
MVKGGQPEEANLPARPVTWRSFVPSWAQVNGDSDIYLMYYYHDIHNFNS